MSRLWLFNILIIIVLFTGCARGKSLAPVVVRDQPPSTKVSYHIVSPGETLYSIAWRYNFDYKSLAKTNKIGKDYKIYPGQKLVLKAAKRTPYVAPPKTSNTSSPAKRAPNANAQVVKKETPERLKNKSNVVKNNTPKFVSKKKIKWTWPSKGNILSHFNAKNGLNKGIDIGGKLGEPVRAASDGVVVYSGEGLRGYGKLIIIKHSEKYLSAYAHNRRLMVDEGEKVVRNEKIAEMGESGTDKVKLHFEIRYDGKPVDPLSYLPPRN